MLISPGQSLVIPELAAHLRLKSSDFVVGGILAGGMGQCIRVINEGRAFALKLIGSELVEDDIAWERYLREIRIWSTVSACEGVVEALAAVKFNGLPAACSPWMAAGSLRPQLQTPSMEFFFSVMARIVGTLAWAYAEHGIVHRDLKPENILLDENRRAFVADWGLAKPLTSPDSPLRKAQKVPSSSQGLTQAGAAPCTIIYASPEQITGHANLDHRADIYSLGILMYEWECGHPPFFGSPPEQIALQQLFERPGKLGGMLRGTRYGLEKLISACLEKSPQNRPRGYDELDAALGAAARRRGFEYRKFVPCLRYDMPLVGAGEFRRFAKSLPNVSRTANGTYAVVEQEDIEKYVQEAHVLMVTGDYAQAKELYSRFFVHELVEGSPDYQWCQLMCVNYGLCLIETGEPQQAVGVLTAIGSAQHKPAAYYVNLSLAQIKVGDFRRAIITSEEGLREYPQDPGLMGNLLIGQTQSGLYPAAAETARVRLAQTRDIHSLLEVSELHSKYAGTLRETDWPLAVKTYGHARNLLKEAMQLNPRDLRVRIQLCNVLGRMGAYANCSEQLSGLLKLQLHLSDRLYGIYLRATCLDRAGCYKECLEFCNRWLMWIAERSSKVSIPEVSRVRLERVRAVTTFDGFCFGVSASDRVAGLGVLEFFKKITADERLREARDFYYLAMHYEWMHDFEAALNELATAEFLYPNYWRIPFRRACLQGQLGQCGAALESAQRATALAPWRRQAWAVLATCLRDLGRNAEAEKAQTRAAEVKAIRDQLTEQVEA